MQASNLVKMMFSSGPDIRANAKLDLMPKLEENSIIKDLIHNAGTICRPSINQEEYFSGHKRHHCVKYQSVLCPDGIIASLMGPYPGRRHDAGIFRESNLYNQLEQRARFAENEKYVLYGDPAYSIQELLLCPFPGRRLAIEQQNFNTRMSSMRQAVEWAFGKIISDFAFLDFKKKSETIVAERWNNV
jgi:hypothetical protein